jgi:hypothetical protein
MYKKHPKLAEFQAECQKYYALFALSVGGFWSQCERFKDAKPGQRIHFSEKDPWETPATATLLVNDLYQFTRRDGAFVDTLAKSLLVTIYTEWDERYRGEFAEAIGVNKRQIIFRLMGDLRKLRHRIVHARSQLRTKDVKFEVLTWKLSEGELIITESMFAELVKLLGNFEVEVTPDAPVT